MSVLPAGVSVHHLHAQCLEKPEEIMVSHGTGVTDSCEWPCRCWELNPLEDLPALLSAEPSLQSAKLGNSYKKTQKKIFRIQVQAESPYTGIKCTDTHMNENGGSCKPSALKKSSYNEGEEKAQTVEKEVEITHPIKGQYLQYIKNSPQSTVTEKHDN